MTRPSLPLRILIVEDEAILVMDLEAVIQDTGNMVLGDAASTDELKRLTLDADPDLALIDVNLSNGTSGLDASGIIRRRWSNAKIVYLTANPAKVPLGHDGAFGVIAKPFTESGLMAALRYICEGITDPPPVAPKPASFREFKTFSGSW